MENVPLKNFQDLFMIQTNQLLQVNGELWALWEHVLITKSTEVKFVPCNILSGRLKYLKYIFASKHI